jgi:diguanylate cyclase (GGDEF)-like protein
LISLKKYLEIEPPEPVPAYSESHYLTITVIDCYLSLLSAIGKGAVQGCYVLGTDLQTSLQGLKQHISIDSSAESMKQTERQVEVLLAEWGGRTANHLKTKADEVKGLLIAMARTAESVGGQSQLYTNQFKKLTANLESIADLDDLTQIRSSLVEHVSELRHSVDQMARDNQLLVAQLRVELSTNETKLKTVEHLVLKDQLTGVASRRSVEERIQRNIDNQKAFCVLMLDINRFKKINDKHGHLAGDDVLKQFASKLKLNTRPGDLVSRWGGDEFIVLLECDIFQSRTYIERIQNRVFGKYTIQGETSNHGLIVQVDASIGTAEWREGETLQQVIARADTAMYQNKRGLGRDS